MELQNTGSLKSISSEKQQAVEGISMFKFENKFQLTETGILMNLNLVLYS